MPPIIATMTDRLAGLISATLTLVASKISRSLDRQRDRSRNPGNGERRCQRAGKNAGGRPAQANSASETIMTAAVACSTGDARLAFFSKERDIAALHNLSIQMPSRVSEHRQHDGEADEKGQ